MRLITDLLKVLRWLFVIVGVLLLIAVLGFLSVAMLFGLVEAIGAGFDEVLLVIGVVLAVGFVIGFFNF